MLSVIAAMSSNRVIGANGSIPWHLPVDMKYFKNTTSKHTIIVGRKTFESFGGSPLPNRRNIVLTRDSQFKSPGAEIFNSLDSALESCTGDKEVFICGGAQIYEQALPLCDKLYITEVNTYVFGDTYFPKIDRDDWIITSESFNKRDTRNEFATTMKILRRIGSNKLGVSM
jgi:dihydrofolate reductase